MGEAVTWALQPGSVAAEVQAELAPFLQLDDPGAAPTVREMVWDVTKAPHCGLPGALINALYCAQTSSGWVGARVGGLGGGWAAGVGDTQETRGHAHG